MMQSHNYNAAADKPVYFREFIVYPGYFTSHEALKNSVLSHRQNQFPKLSLVALSDNDFDACFADLLSSWRITHLAIRNLSDLTISKLIARISFNILTRITLTDISDKSYQLIYDEISSSPRNQIILVNSSDNLTWQRKFEDLHYYSCLNLLNANTITQNQLILNSNEIKRLNDLVQIQESYLRGANLNAAELKQTIDLSVKEKITAEEMTSDMQEEVNKAEIEISSLANKIKLLETQASRLQEENKAANTERVIFGKSSYMLPTT